MYCPSCDKSYGAVHSRCPECHSWLKVSAPSSARKGGKSGASSTAASSPAPTSDQGGVSTLDRDSGSSLGGGDGGWADPAPSSPGNWGDSGGDSWGSPAAGSGAASSASDGWGGASGGGAAPSWSGNDKSDSFGWGSEPAGSATAPPSQKDNGWLDAGGSQDGWGGSGAASAPSVPSAPSPGGGGDGWLGGGGPEPSSGSSSGWLGGGGPEPSAGSSSSGSGWLADQGGPADSDGGGGWLGDSAGGATPSMTEMVDQAISVEESDDFVDDSWVDEEIRENDFDDLDIPEYAPPAPEVGGAFLKMLLVAVLVLLVGGGILFAKNDKADPEQTAADETVKRLEFGRATMKSGETDLKAGKPGLAIPQLQEALVALSEGKAPQDEIYQAEILLGKALMGDEDYEEAYKHWKSLKESGQEKYVATAVQGLNDSSRQLRIRANEFLAEGKKYAAKDEITSVKRLGRDALELYKNYGGSNSQLGDAHGVIGRGHFNGREYAQAKDEFKRAVALAPGIGYESYLNQVSNILAPKQYIPPVQSAPRSTRSVSKPTFSIGQPDYQRSSGRRGGGRRSSSSSGSSGDSGSAAPAPKKMKEIPIHRSSKPSSGGPRKGSKGVLKGY